MDIDWKTVQMFLSDNGVFEVQIDADNNKKVRCNCPDFMNSARCKHQKHVRGMIDSNDGHYTIMVPDDVSEEEAIEAMRDSESMRQFIIRHARIEVL